MRLEKEHRALPGIPILLLLLVLLALFTWFLVRAIMAEAPLFIFVTTLGLTAVIVVMTGLFTVHPNEAKVLQLFGKYVGTDAPARALVCQPLLYQTQNLHPGAQL